ncbi:MAG: DUF456 domain-containing protein [Deltaproteobacteria bacterium]|nr:DUF456 domain-containing protein [Deltaproteobacteria bacterium]
MSSLASTGFFLFILLLFVGIYLSLFGLPGTIIIFLDVLLYGFFTGFGQVGWKVLLFLLCFAVLAETLDFLTGLTKAHKPPVLKKSLWGAGIGASVGMIIFTPLLWGLGTWMGFFIGGLTGTVLMELLHQYRLKAPQQVSNGAFLAMIGRKALKGSLALIMIFVSLSAIYS